MRILIADDSEVLRRGVRNILSDSLWDICGEAPDGSTAIRMARELQPELILLDISMPGLNGLETARLLRQELPQVKILVMSQHDPLQLLPRALEAGAYACIDKGRLATDLLASIRSAGTTTQRRDGTTTVA